MRNALISFFIQYHLEPFRVSLGLVLLTCPDVTITLPYSDPTLHTLSLTLYVLM